MDYRKDLDGLRALAVLSVIFYHAKISVSGVHLFSGGFFGVDIFFVLSGYLITKILKDGITNKFTFIEFYWRRAKRIIPALLFMLFVTTLFAYKILLPDQLVSYAKSLNAALYFSSNFYFFNEDGYTTAASIFKPLLHTWSLGVEWQFYMLFPILMFAIRKSSTRFSVLIISLLFFTSLQIASATVVEHPNFAFYLLPSRAWELLAGSLCVYFQGGVNLKTHSHLNKVLPSLGISLVLLSIFLITDKENLPSYLSLIPVIGTCIYLLYANNSDLVTRTLSLRPVVFVGVISYSLYLWHQPVFVFYRFTASEALSLYEVFSLTVISIILAIMSYYLIESPARNIKNKVYALPMSLAIVVLFVGGNSFINNNGYPQRLSGIASIYGKGSQLPKMNECGDGVGSFCLNHNDKSNNEIILVGDSHAQAMSSSLYELATKSGYNFTNFSMASCPVISLITKKLNDGNDDACNNLSKNADEYIKKHKNSIVIYMTRMPLYMLNDKYKVGQWLFSTTGNGVASDIIESINRWRTNGNTVVVVYPVPQPPFDVPTEANKKLSEFKSIDQKLNAFKKQGFLSFDKSKYQHVWDVNFKKSIDLFNSVSDSRVLRIIPGDLLCNNNICKTHDNDHLLYSDDNHLTYYGMHILVDDIKRKLNSTGVGVK